MKKNITIEIKERYTKDVINNMLKNKEFAYKALMLLYNRQTADEKTKKYTIYKNNQGFNKADAKFMSNMAIQFKIRGYINYIDFNEMMRRIQKYANQIAKIMNKEI